MLTNPHRIMMQFRLGRGLNEHFLDGDTQLTQSEHTRGRVPILILKNFTNKMVQANRYNAPVLPGLEGLRVQTDFWRFLTSWSAGSELDPIRQERKLKDRYNMLSRLSPVVGVPLALSFEQEFFGARPFAPKRVPYAFVEHDLLQSNGMMMDIFQIRSRPLRSYETEDYPGQQRVWETNEPAFWHMFTNGWHGPVPVLPGMTEETFLSKGEKIPLVGGLVDPVGEFADRFLPLGWAIRAGRGVYRGIKEGTIGLTYSGRAMNTAERLDRASFPIIEWILEKDYERYRANVKSGKRKPLYPTLSVDDLKGLRFQYDEETGDLKYVTEYIDPVTGEVTPIEGRGAAPRPGTKEWMAVLFNVEEVLEFESAKVKAWHNQLRLMERAAGELERQLKEREGEAQLRPYSTEEY